MEDNLQVPDSLLTDVSQLIDTARQRVAVAVNAELSMLYWRVGKRINDEVLQDKRAQYGKEVVLSLSRKLTEMYGNGWSEKSLRHCLRAAETFTEDGIVSALRRQLNWTQLKRIMYLSSDLEREFCVPVESLRSFSEGLYGSRRTGNTFAALVQNFTPPPPQQTSFHSDQTHTPPFVPSALPL